MFQKIVLLIHLQRLSLLLGKSTVTTGRCQMQVTRCHVDTRSGVSRL